MSKVKRVLVYRLGSLGDTLVALPALHLVRRVFAEAEVRLLTNHPVSTKAPPAAAVLEGSGLVDGYLRYSVGTRSVVELARLWWSIARWRPEVLVYLGAARGVASAKRDAVFFRLCGVRRLVGVPVTEAMQQNFFGAVSSERLAYREPEAARLTRNILELGDARLKDASSWDLRLSEAERTSAAEMIPPDVIGTATIAVSVGTKVQAKDWGRENWKSLLTALARRYPEHLLMMVGAPEESEASEFAATGWRGAGGGAVVNLCGKLSPRESAAALSCSVRVFVGHDSGPMHLAAAVGTPCVAVFAARSLPRVWFPVGEQHRVVYHEVDCMGCGLETCVVERKKCILSISVAEVMAAVEDVMAKAPSVR